MTQAFTVEQYRSALLHIDPGVDRDTWVRCLTGAKAAGLALEDAIEWSSGGPTFKEADTRAVWRSLKSDGGISAGTLIYEAKAAGWQPDGAHAQRSGGRHSVPPPLRSDQHQGGHQAPRISAQATWDAAPPATEAHPYIERKGGVPDGLRIAPVGLRIAGNDLAGALLVPVRTLDGQLVSLQAIPAEGPKLNLPGHPMKGVFIVGDPADLAGRATVVEGIGQAWACHRATGHPAVVTFGWGRVRETVQELRSRFPQAQIAIVPDVGKEDDARRIADEHEAMVATMPTGSPNNYDANDYAREHGHDALEELLAACEAPPAQHPLAQFLTIGDQPSPPSWIIPGFIASGVVVVAGAWGVGKTTCLLPLAMIAAGLHRPGDPLAPRQWRHVIYVTEDPGQASRILLGMVRHGNLGLDMAVVRERLHLVEARRLPPEQAVEVGKVYRRQFTRRVGGVDVLPLVVFDTKAAVLAVEDENDNAQASALMASLKQSFEHLPVWLVGHLAKADISRVDVATLTARGAGAIEADAHQTLFLVREKDETRYLVQGKRRFEPTWSELQIPTECAHADARNEWGEPERVTLRWGVPTPPDISRAEARDQAAQQARTEAESGLRSEVLELVRTAEASGNPLNRAGAKARIKRRAAEVVACIENLISERWLVEVSVPPSERLVMSRGTFLVALSTEQHDDVVRNGAPIPVCKLSIPSTWRKAAPPVPVGEAPPPDSADALAPDSTRSHSTRSLKDGNAGTGGQGRDLPPVHPPIPVELGTGRNGSERVGTGGASHHDQVGELS